MELDKSGMKKIALLIAFGVAFYMAVKNLYLLPSLVNSVFGIIGPVLAGFAIAFVINILVVQLETRLFLPLNRRFQKIWPKVRRAVSIFLSLLIIIGLVALVLLIIIPELVRTITSLANSIPSFFNKLQKEIDVFYKAHPKMVEYFKDIDIDWTNVSSMLERYGQTAAKGLVDSTVTVTTGIFHGAISLVLSFVISLNALAQKEKLNRQAKRILRLYLPHRYAEPIFHILHLIHRAFYNFIAGTCTEACILATLCFIGMNIFRFPYALLISVFVAFMALIPILGSFFSTVIGALLISIVSPIQALWYVVFFVVLQQLEGNLIYPYVVGYRVGLPALWVLVAITIGGNTFGVLGMLVSIPIGSVLYTLLKENMEKREKGPT